MHVNRHIISADNLGILKGRGLVYTSVGGFGVITNSNDPISTSPHPSIFSGTGTLPLYKWTFVSASYDYASKTASIYVDGTYNTISNVNIPTLPPNLASSSLTLAGAPSHSTTVTSDVTPPPISSTTSHCLIDSVFVYSGSLSKSQLDYLRLHTPTPLPPSPTGYAVQLNGERHVIVSDPISVKEFNEEFGISINLNPIHLLSNPAPVFSVKDSLKFSIQHLGNETSSARVRVQMSNGNGVYDFDWTSSVPAVPVGEFTSLGLIRTTEEIQIIHNGNVVASTPYDSDNQIPTTDEETFELLLGGDADDEEALTTLSNFVSEIDEFTFHTTPTPTHRITNPTSDLIVHLKFDEGRGLNLHNSAVNSDINNHRLSIPSTEFMVKTGKPETWVYSTLPQPSINTLEDTPIIITLNGTSSTSDPLTAILTSLPIYGSLHYPTNTNLDGQVVTYDPTPILTINSTVNVGRSLVYVPVGNMKGEDTFEYAVKTTSTSNFSPDEFSPTVNQVKIDVTSINDPTYFTFNPTNKLSLSFLNYYTVMDVDTLEEDWDSAALETEIKVETGEGVKSVMTVRGDENSLVWGQGMVKGGEKVEVRHYFETWRSAESESTS